MKQMQWVTKSESRHLLNEVGQQQPHHRSYNIKLTNGTIDNQYLLIQGFISHTLSKVMYMYVIYTVIVSSEKRGY